MSTNISVSYRPDFEFFLTHTDEKEIILSEIEKYIDKYKVKSLLDIGAGNGKTAIFLKKNVSRYLALCGRRCANYQNRLGGHALSAYTSAENYPLY